MFYFESKMIFVLLSLSLTSIIKGKLNRKVLIYQIVLSRERFHVL